jgi:hypothetical protein
VQYMMQEQQQVHVIGFCGTKHWDNHLADANASYAYFRHLCACQKVDLRFWVPST